MKNVLFKFNLDTGKLAGTGHFFRCLKIYEISQRFTENIDKSERSH